MIRILLADDHAVVREGIKQILARERAMQVVEEACSGQEVSARLSDGVYDVLLLDISMPGRNGLEILKEAKASNPNIQVLVLSMHPEDRFALRALREGASGYLTKDCAPEELVKAVHRVARGGKYITQSLAEKLALDLDSDFEKPLHERLSNREYQVMCMIASGKSVTEIAAELFLSVKTISTHRRRILDKMKLNQNTEITHYAFEHKLID